MNIGIIDFDGKIPNLALMKISCWHKNRGDVINFGVISGCDRLYISITFSKNKENLEKYLNVLKCEDIRVGGTGWDPELKLPKNIENCNPDFSLYSAEYLYPKIKGIGSKKMKFDKALTLVNSGIGFLNRGCIRSCRFCCVPKKEGNLTRVNSLSNILNPKSNNLILMDNNLTADPQFEDVCQEIIDRDLTVDITQGIDIRLIDEEKALLLSKMKHLRSIHYAWDLMSFESDVLEGIKILSKYIKPYRHMCFCLTNFNTDFDEDMYRFRKLIELNVDPMIMVYQDPDPCIDSNCIIASDHNRNLEYRKKKHFARWVNSRIYKVCKFEEYTPFIKDLENIFLINSNSGLFR